MSIRKIIDSYFKEKTNIIDNLSRDSIIKSFNLIKETIDNGNQIFCCGNGGSALTASHYVTDWTKFSLQNKNIKVRAICLNDNIGAITAYANDISYEDIFAQHLTSYSKKDDLLIVVSGSGNSKNLIKAVTRANELSLRSLGILGFDGGILKDICDLSIVFKTFDMQQAEDFHLSYGHMFMKYIST